MTHSTATIGIPPYCWLILLAVALRLGLFAIGAPSLLSDRVELVTAVTKFDYVLEGLFLAEQGLSPYAGGTCHHPPLVLLFFSVLSQIGGKNVLVTLHALLSILGDVLASFFLYRIASTITSQPEMGIGRSDTRSRVSPIAVAGIYLFNPFTLASCLSLSTVLWTNVSVLGALCFVLDGRVVLSMLWLAVATYTSLDSIMLLVPLALVCGHSKGIAVGSFFGWLGGLLVLSYLSLGSWDFLQHTYGFAMMAFDTTPNIMPFWYFVTESFDEFRPFFAFVLRLHSFLYVVPLCIRLPYRPLFMFWIVTIIIAMFKGYSSYGDCALYLAMAPLHLYAFEGVAFLFFIMNCFAYVVVLGALFWDMWIVTGRGNANFYFAINLVFIVCQGVLVVQLLRGIVRGDYMRRWLERKDKEAKSE
eukprot:TRINITY_DN16762_c0_g1_i1.p1 TRINITY_DN16762_c0_g1~~TRINITY_DN16762_c0_g1_i1.p1  ORF type:complete len:416 (-),score=64.04 TRINITY_DN16762_c0_g1_i1:30-1277(-)